MTKTFTLITGEEVTYKGLQTMAKDFGVRANQSAVVLVEFINKCIEVDTNLHTATEDDEYELMMADLADTKEIASAASNNNPVTTVQEDASEASIQYEEGMQIEYRQPAPKLFEFVRADNCIVVFKQNGIKVTIGWSKKDFKCYSHKEDSKPKLMMVQTAINVFKQYKNGRDGDIARIVKALTHIKCKPSIISAMEKQLRGQQNVSAASQKENTTPTKSRRSSAGVIDAEWLKHYQNQQGENYDARNVRQAYEEYISEASVHSAG